MKRTFILALLLAPSFVFANNTAELKALKEETKHIRMQIKELKASKQLTKAREARDKAAKQLQQLMAGEKN